MNNCSRVADDGCHVNVGSCGDISVSGNSSGGTGRLRRRLGDGPSPFPPFPFHHSPFPPSPFPPSPFPPSPFPPSVPVPAVPVPAVPLPSLPVRPRSRRPRSRRSPVPAVPFTAFPFQVHLPRSCRSPFRSTSTAPVHGVPLPIFPGPRPLFVQFLWRPYPVACRFRFPCIHSDCKRLRTILSSMIALLRHAIAKWRALMHHFCDAGPNATRSRRRVLKLTR